MLKTIFTYLPSAQTSSRLTAAAAQLAARHGARIIGAHNSPKLMLYGGIPQGFLAQYQEQQRAQAEAIERNLADAAGAQNVAYHWRHKQQLLDTESFEDIIAAARTADLIVAGGRGEDDPLGHWYDLPIRLIMETGRPVLLIPARHESAALPKRVIIGWNRTRESARAAFDAIPLLKSADLVRVVSINPVDIGAVGPVDELVAALRQHEVNAEGAVATTISHTDSEELLKEATRFEADLLVMGCYGHSRVKQMILGGATRHVLETMTTPVLMSH